MRSRQPKGPEIAADGFLELFLGHLSSDHGYSQQQIRSMLQKEPIAKGISIPVPVFSVRKLGSFEALVKYLHEERRISLSQIGRLTNRDPRTIWNVFHSSKRKHPEPLLVQKSDVDVPLEIFSERKLSVLESLVRYLHFTHGLGYSKIAQLLNRDPRTIHTVKTRAARKINNG